MVSIINCWLKNSECDSLFLTVILVVLLLCGCVFICFCNNNSEKTKRLNAEIDFDWKKTVLKKSLEQNIINEKLEQINKDIKIIISKLDKL